jgi:hypothetical protein
MLLKFLPRRQPRWSSPNRVAFATAIMSGM